MRQLSALTCQEVERAAIYNDNAVITHIATQITKNDLANFRRDADAKITRRRGIPEQEKTALRNLIAPLQRLENELSALGLGRETPHNERDLN